MLSPPISCASEPKSGRVATTFSLACAEKAEPRTAEKITKNFFMGLEFVSAVRAKDEFELEKDRIGLALGEEKIFLEPIMVVLEPDF